MAFHPIHLPWVIHHKGMVIISLSFTFNKRQFHVGRTLLNQPYKEHRQKVRGANIQREKVTAKR
jgi:hypothetical protein